MTDHEDRESPITARAPAVHLVAAIEESAHAAGRDRRSDPLPPHAVSTPIQIAANSAIAAQKAALEAAGMAGEMLGRCSLLESSHKLLVAEVRLTNERIGGIDARIDHIAEDITGIARAVGARRTYSGQVALSLPPRGVMRAAPTDTGHNLTVPREEVERFERMFAEHAEAVEQLERKLDENEKRLDEERAKKRGAEEELERQRSAEAKAEEKRDAKRKTAGLALTLAGLIIALASAGITHLSLAPSPTPVPAAPL